MPEEIEGPQEPAITDGGGGSGGSGQTIKPPDEGGGLETVDPDSPMPSGAVENSFCFEFDGRLFYCDAPLGRTFCYDPQAGATGSGEWTDTGWNSIFTTYVVRDAGIEETLLLSGIPTRVWNPIEGRYIFSGAIVTAWPFMTNRLLNPLQVKRYVGYHHVDWPKIVKFRPMDGEGTMMRNRLKRLIRLTIWGDQEDTANPQRIGWVSVTSDRGRTERYPMITKRLPGRRAGTYATVPDRGMLTSQGFTGNMVGRVFTPMVHLEQTAINVRDILMEYVILD